MTSCDIQVQPGGAALAEALERATAGARICLLPGEHVGGLELTRSVTLVGLEGAEKTTLRGPGRLPVLRIEDDGLAVRIQGITLQNGESDAGGGLVVRGRGKVHVADCRFTNNRAGMIGGGGLYARAGMLTVERSRFDHNHGKQGGGIFLDMTVHAELTRCVIEDNEAVLGGGMRVAEGVVLDCKASQFRKNLAAGQAQALHVSGTRSRKPSVDLNHCTIEDGAVVNGPEIPGEIKLKACKVPASWRGTAGLADHGGNTFVP